MAKTITNKLQAYEAELKTIQAEIDAADGEATEARAKRIELWKKGEKLGLGRRAIARMSGCDPMLIVRALK